MRPMELVALIRRNLALVLIGILLTALAEAWLVYQVGPRYAASAKVLLLPPPASLPATANPLLSMGGLEPVGGVLYAHLSSEQVVDRIVGDDDAKFTLIKDPFSSAPIVVVTVTAASPTVATRVLEKVMEEIPSGLESIQESAEIETGSQISSVVLVPPQRPGKIWSGLLRMAIAAAAAGAVLTLFLTVTFDALREARRERRSLRRVLDEARLQQQRR